MIKWTFLPHTADVRLKVESDTLEGLFEGALQGMGELLKEGSCTRPFHPQLSETVAVSSVDRTSLLIDFLSQVLTLSFERKAIFCHINIDQISETSLHGRLEGYFENAFEEDVKAVTYHEADVQRNETGNWETIIVFDI